MACPSGPNTTRVLLALWLAAVPSASAQSVRVTTLLGESSGLVAPVVVAVKRTDNSEWRAGIVGWSLSAGWTGIRSPRRAWLAQIDVTPINAHQSNRQFVDGAIVDSLGYRNATLQVSGGVRWMPHPEWTTEVRGVLLREVVDDLPVPIQDFWSRPFVGLDVSQRYERVRADDPLRARFEGVRVVARAQGFAGAESWGMTTLAVTGGHRVGRLHWRGGTTGVAGTNLNIVSAFLTSGSFDAAGAGALYGYAQGQFRLQRGAVLNSGLDLRLRGTTDVGVRGGWMREGARWRSGAAVQMATVWRGMVVQGGVAAPSGALDRALVTASVGWGRVQ